MKASHRQSRLLTTALLASCAYAQNPACTTPPNVTVYQQVVSIKTDVLMNGTFAPVPGHNVAITNAPTSIDTLTTLSWTTSFTSGLPSAGAPAPGDVNSANNFNTGSTFYLVLTPLLARQKRQAGFSYVGTNGNAVGSCASAPTYSLVNGQLFAYQGGVTYQFSASPGVAYAKFVPTTIPGPITTTFAFASGDILSWTNPLFFNGGAQFCSTIDGTVYAVFQENAQPVGCFYIALSLYSQSACQSAALASANAASQTVDKWLWYFGEVLLTHCTQYWQHGQLDRPYWACRPCWCSRPTR